MNFITENNSVREAVIVLYIVSAWGDCLISALNLEHSLIWRPVPSNSSDSLSLLGEILPYSEFTVNFLVLFNSYYHALGLCSRLSAFWGEEMGFSPAGQEELSAVHHPVRALMKVLLTLEGRHTLQTLILLGVLCLFSFLWFTCSSSHTLRAEFLVTLSPLGMQWPKSVGSSFWWLECHFLCYPTKGRILHLGLVAPCSGSADKFILFLLWRSEVRNESMGLNEVSVLGLFPVRVSWGWSVPHLFQFRWMSAFLGLRL